MQDPDNYYNNINDFYSDISAILNNGTPQSNFTYTNLTGRYIQETDSGDLIDLLGGVSVPYISGSELDQIFDFSVLNDDRFDKGSYVGNAYGLPEYYNSPWGAEFYYDDTSETTRHYWKLTDFHYANILAQTVDTDIQNNYFLKAKATTDTSNIIASWSELLIYSTSQTGVNLSKLKTYIGIQPDFYGDNIAVGWNTVVFWNTVGANWSVQDGISITSNGTSGSIQKNGLWTIGKTYQINIRGVRTSGSLWSPYDGTGSVKNIISGTSFDETYQYIPDTSSNMVIFSALYNGTVTFLEIKQLYQNYYKL